MAPPMSAPRLAILLPFRDAERTLPAAIDSLLWQTFEDFTLLLLDDGSADGSRAVVEALDDPRTVLLSDGANRGLPVRLNQGVEWVADRGIELIARMDADDVAHPDRLALQIARLDAEPALDLIGTGSVVTHHRARIVGCRRPPADHEAICRTPYRRFPLSHPTWLGRTAWFRRHPYDRDARRSQDYQLLRRAHATSRFANLPELLLAYDEGERHLGKAIRSRVACAANLWRLGVPRDELPHAVAGSAGLLAGALADVAIGLTGRPDLGGLRLAPPTAAERTEWTELLRRLSSRSRPTARLTAMQALSEAPA